MTDDTVRAGTRRGVIGGFRFGAAATDRLYVALLRTVAIAIFLLVAGIAVELTLASRESLHAFGWRFFVSGAWNPVTEDFGARDFVLGTLYTSFWGLVIAVPVSVAAAVFLAEIAPPGLRPVLASLIELLAAVPSVVYGLWGIFVLAPWLSDHVETWISNNRTLSHLGLFAGAPNGNDYLAASLILAVMITPIITSVSRDLLRAVPAEAREASYALGATRAETVLRVVLPGARSGIIGAVILGLGRALGETMAVTMVIGNNPTFHWSLFSPGYTMASVIANEFSEASLTLYRSALVEIGLVLFLVTLIVNGCARLLVYQAQRHTQGAATT